MTDNKSDAIPETGVEVEIDIVRTEVVINIGIGAVINTIKINPIEIKVEIVIEIEVKKDEGIEVMVVTEIEVVTVIEIKVMIVIEIEVMIVTEIEVMIVIEIKVLTVTEIEINMTIVILEGAEAKMDQEKKDMKKSMISNFLYFYLLLKM